jgi:hypothetical protein
VDVADLRLTGVRGGLYQLGSFAYNPTTRTGSWSLLSPAAVDRLMLALDGDDSASDGNFGVRTASGNFLVDGDYSLAFSALEGDFNGDGTVMSGDLVGIRNRMPSFGGAYDLRADIDGDGDVDLNDVNAAKRRVGAKLP